jgi:hypothetical protein
MKIKINLSTTFGKILRYKISWKFIQYFSYSYTHTQAHSYLNRFFKEIKTWLKMSEKLRNKYTVINHHLGKFQSQRMFPITWWHKQMCVLMSLMSLEKWILLLTLASYTAPQILYNFRHIQNHKKRLLPQPFSCSSVHTHRLSPHWTDFCEIYYWGLWWKFVTKIQIWLKSAKNLRNFAWRPK